MDRGAGPGGVVGGQAPVGEPDDKRTLEADPDRLVTVEIWAPDALGRLCARFKEITAGTVLDEKCAEQEAREWTTIDQIAPGAWSVLAVSLDHPLTGIRLTATEPDETVTSSVYFRGRVLWLPGHGELRRVEVWRSGRPEGNDAPGLEIEAPLGRE